MSFFILSRFCMVGHRQLVQIFSITLETVWLGPLIGPLKTPRRGSKASVQDSNGTVKLVFAAGKASERTMDRTYRWNKTHTWIVRDPNQGEWTCSQRNRSRFLTRTCKQRWKSRSLKWWVSVDLLHSSMVQFFPTSINWLHVQWIGIINY